MNNNSGIPKFDFFPKSIYPSERDYTFPNFEPYRITPYEDSKTVTMHYTRLVQPPKMDFNDDAMEFCKDLCGMMEIQEEFYGKFREALGKEMQEARLAAVEAFTKLAWLHGSYQLALLDIVGDLYNFNTEKEKKDLC